MTETSKPMFYEKIRKQFPEIFQAVENLGTTLRTTGPLDEKTTQLIQLAAAAANQSEGSVRSHTRRALQAGAQPDEITHTLLLLVSTIGFPQSMAAMSWAQDILEKESTVD